MATTVQGVTEMRLAVKYTGVDTDRGRLGALDLGPAIIGVGELFGEASRVLYGDGTRIRVEVDAQMRRASFGLDFFAVSVVSGLLPPVTLQDLANVAVLLGFVGGAGMGLVDLVRWARGRKLTAARREGDIVNIEINDESQQITINEYNIFINPTVRKGLEALTDPLEREGVDSVEIRMPDQPPQIIERTERALFKAPPTAEQEVVTDTVTGVLEIVAPALRGDYKWRFAQEGQTFMAAVEDTAFLQRVARASEKFAAGDALRVKMDVTTYRTAEGWRFERVVKEVIGHYPAEPGGGQLPLI